MVNITPRKSVITPFPLPQAEECFGIVMKTEQKPSYCEFSYKCAVAAANQAVRNELFEAVLLYLLLSLTKFGLAYC